MPIPLLFFSLGLDGFFVAVVDFLEILIYGAVYHRGGVHLSMRL